MPILQVNNPPGTPSNAPNPSGDYRTQAELKTSTIFNKELSVSKIAHQVSGMPWTIDYFNQILNVNSQPLAPDINIPETTLKYNRIEKLDIYLDSGLPASNVVDITGSGTINAGFVPFIGDAFIATLAGGRIGIFVLTTVTKEYYNTHDIYKVDFKLTYFADISVAMYNDLIHKVARTYVYDKNAIDTFSNPIILASEYKKKLDISLLPNEIVNYYLDTFLDPETKTFRLPTVGSRYVDQLINNFMFSILSVHDFPKMSNMARLKHIDGVVSIWDALLKRDIKLLDVCNIGLTYAIADIGYSLSTKLISYLGIEFAITDRPNMAILTPSMKTNPLASRKVVTSPISNPDGKYILSSNFYNQTPGTIYTDMETLVIEYLRGEIPNVALLDNVIADYKYWTYEDQYMILPMLLIVIKSLMNNTYSSL